MNIMTNPSMSGGQVRVQGQRETEINFLKKQFYKTSTGTGQLVFCLASNSKIVNENGVLAILEKFRVNHNIKIERLTVKEVLASIPYIVDTVYQPMQERLFDENLATYLNMRIPEHPATHSDHIRPPVPTHSATCDALP